MKMPLILRDEVKFVLAKYPDAFCCVDGNGYYIVPTFQDRQTILGRGRKPMKAWKDAVKNLSKKKKGPKAKP